jgi:hypothetical protein
MKTFVAVLGAILAAGIIFLIGHGMVARFSEWQNQKDAMIRMIQRNSASYEAAYSSVMNGPRTVESANSALADMKTAMADNREAYGLLKFVLSNKPFFALNADEEKWLAKSRRELGEENETPTPGPPSMPEFVTLNMAASVYDEQRNEIRIPAGTKLKLLSYSQHEIKFRYNSGTYSLPAAITDFKKY